MKFRLCLILTLLSSLAVAQKSDDPLLEIVETELKREWQELSKLSQPAYFVSYRVTDMQYASVASSFGSLIYSNKDRHRLFMVDVKVGDYALDNSRAIEDYEGIAYDRQMYASEFGSSLPLDDRKEAIVVQLWKSTENAYKSSLELYKAVKNSKSAEKNKHIHDFSKETPAVHVEPPAPDLGNLFDQKQWEERVKKFSSHFLASEHIVQANASVEFNVERKYFLSTEGSKVVQNRTSAFISISASIRATDGDIIPLHLSYFAFEPKGLPSDETIQRDVVQMMSKLEQLRNAPVAEPYTGPAILHARAAGVFFHEIFGHRIEGHRLKNENDGQTFKGKVNQLVLPKTLSITSDPTMQFFNGRAMNGHYHYDDEGVKGQKVTVVENGVLKSFLMSRCPIEGFPNSNGHARAEPGTGPVARQSNLIIETKKAVEMSDLRKMLIAECRKQKKKYGYLFMDVIGGFTTTQRDMPNAFNIFPIEVYRIYVDGRPDELVRGVDLIGTPLAMFAGIAATDNKSEVFTGFCGAESGSIPVTAVSPSLFVKRIETQKKSRYEAEPPLLERPNEKMKEKSTK